MDVNVPFRGESQPEQSAAGAEYLDALTRHPAVRRYKALTFDLALAGAPRSLLDVGCGVGEDAMAMSELASGSVRVVGVDINAEFVEESRRRATARRADVEFVLANGDERLPFRDQEFGAVRADRVLQHLEQPGALVEEMVRLIEAGGRIVLSEPDWGALSISGLGSAEERAVVGLVSASFPSPRVGRDLARELERNGLVDIDERRDSLVISRLAEAEALLSIGALIEQRSAGSEATRIAAALADLDASDRLRIEMVGFVVSARLPATSHMHPTGPAG